MFGGVNFRSPAALNKAAATALNKDKAVRSHKGCGDDTTSDGLSCGADSKPVSFATFCLQGTPLGTKALPN